MWGTQNFLFLHLIYIQLNYFQIVYIWSDLQNLHRDHPQPICRHQLGQLNFDRLPGNSLGSPRLMANSPKLLPHHRWQIDTSFCNLGITRGLSEKLWDSMVQFLLFIHLLERTLCRTVRWERRTGPGTRLSCPTQGRHTPRYLKALPTWSFEMYQTMLD